MSESGLNPKLQKVFDYIAQEIASRGYAPSVREIGSACQISSSSTVHSYLKQLESLGYVKRDPAKPRAMILGTAAAGVFSGVSQQPSKTAAEMRGLNPGPDMILPEARIKPFTEASGGPITEPVKSDWNDSDRTEAKEELIPFFPFSRLADSFVSGEGLTSGSQQFRISAYFAAPLILTEMPDDSMRNINLFPGDRIVVHPQNQAEDGDVILAIYQGQAFIRTYYKGLKQIRLQPEKDKVDSLSVLPEDLSILGKVLGLFRRF